MPIALRLTESELERKRRAILTHRTQLPLRGRSLLRFAAAQEPFLPLVGSGIRDQGHAIRMCRIRRGRLVLTLGKTGWPSLGRRNIAIAIQTEHGAMERWRVDVPGAGPVVRTRAAALARAALSLSGDTEQFVIVDGVRYSHVVDPRTGVGLTSRRQAAVVAADGLTADGLSTALTVLDDAGQAALLREYPGVVAEVWRAR